MDRTLLYQVLSTYMCGEFARRSPVVAVQDKRAMRSSGQDRICVHIIGEKHELVTETHILREHYVSAS